MMDDDFIYDRDEVMKNIDSAEVISVFFPGFRKAMVVDTRHTDSEGPMIRIMPMAASPQERLRRMRRLRPGFPRVRRLTLIPWPRYVDSLVTLGVWDRIVQRLKNSDYKDGDADTEYDSVLEELRRLEKAELAAVVLGENCHTIWSARQ